MVKLMSPKVALTTPNFLNRRISLNEVDEVDELVRVQCIRRMDTASTRFLLMSSQINAKISKFETCNA